MKHLSLAIILLFFLSNCKNQEVQTKSNVARPDIGLPISKVSPDQAMIEAQVVDIVGGNLTVKIIRQLEVGHSFKEILQGGKKTEISCDSCNELSTMDTISCIIEKSSGGTFKLISYKKQ
ncbi:MAG: hypothetical protein RIF46_02735 [Cyclobacteriaceae bacterium]